MALRVVGMVVAANGSRVLETATGINGVLVSEVGIMPGTLSVGKALGCGGTIGSANACGEGCRVAGLGRFGWQLDNSKSPIPAVIQ